MTQLLIVALGGAIGGAARYWASGVVARRIGEVFPWGTLAVNASGALLLGLLAAHPRVAAAQIPGSTAWLFLAVGVLGSYTTVSSFSLQTLALLRTGETARALSNVGLSFALCLAAAGAGYVAGRLVLGG